jgi:hypothetical protein
VQWTCLAFILSQRWKRHSSPKRRGFSELHAVTIQKTVQFKKWDQLYRDIVIFRGLFYNNSHWELHYLMHIILSLRLTLHLQNKFGFKCSWLNIFSFQINMFFSYVNCPLWMSELVCTVLYTGDAERRSFALY